MPCDYSLALRSDVLGGFLRWDPSQLPTAPAGYLGDPNVLHTVVGAPYHRDGIPVNYVAVYDGPVDPAHLLLKTDKFDVMGKLGGPLVADPSSVTFPDPLPGRTRLRPRRRSPCPTRASPRSTGSGSR